MNLKRLKRQYPFVLSLSGLALAFAITGLSVDIFTAHHDGYHAYWYAFVFLCFAAVIYPTERPARQKNNQS